MREWKKEVERRLAGLRLTPAREAEIVEELAQHLADRYQELEADGVGEAEAQRLVLEEISEEKLLAGQLRDVEELSYEEIGAITGLPEGTVKSRIHRARAQLKELVERALGEKIQ